MGIPLSLLNIFSTRDPSQAPPYNSIPHQSHDSPLSIIKPRTTLTPPVLFTPPYSRTSFHLHSTSVPPSPHTPTTSASSVSTPTSSMPRIWHCHRCRNQPLQTYELTLHVLDKLSCAVCSHTCCQDCAIQGLEDRVLYALSSWEEKYCDPRNGGEGAAVRKGAIWNIPGSKMKKQGKKRGALAGLDAQKTVGGKKRKRSQPPPTATAGSGSTRKLNAREVVIAPMVPAKKKVKLPPKYESEFKVKKPVRRSPRTLAKLAKEETAEVGVVA